MRRNVIIFICILAFVLLFYFLFKGKNSVKTPEQGTQTEAVTQVPEEQTGEEVSEEPDSESVQAGESNEGENKDAVPSDLVEKKKEYLKTLNQIDKYFVERLDSLRKEISALTPGDPKRSKIEEEVERIEKEYDALKEEINKMKKDVGTKAE